MARSIEKIYGDALFQSAKAANEQERVFEEALTLIAAYEGKESPEKATENLSDTMKGFLSVVSEKSREDGILPFLREYAAMVREEKKIGTATVVSASPLSPEKEEAVRGKLLAATGLEQLEITFSVDPKLIGGMVVAVGDRMLDNSVRTRLRKLSSELSNTVVDKA